MVDIDSDSNLEDQLIYLDHGATTLLHSEVLAEMMPYMKTYYGNASSIHSLGRKSRSAIENARNQIANLIGAKSSELLFTGSGTESDNIAILGTAYRLRKRGKHVITTNIEHPGVRNAFRKLQTDGFKVTQIPIDKEGLISIDNVKNAIQDDTTLISVMYANNEIGTIQPIQEIGELCQEHNIIFHTDAVQAFGKVPINLQKLPVDLLSASAHKIYGPKGVGLLFLRNQGIHPIISRYIQPISFGGGQEYSLRPSTENVYGIVGFAKAVEIAFQDMSTENERLTELRDDFIKWVLKEIPESALNGHPKIRLGNNINLSFGNISGEDILRQLETKGVMISTGSACHSKSRDVSYVLMALGISEEAAESSIRITLGRSTTIDQLKEVKVALQQTVAKLRSKT
jgi:cysteine desulfurase